MKLKPATLSALTKKDIKNAIIAETPGGIEAQETYGQQDFVASDTLPRECLYCTREQLERMGIIFGKNVDELFVEVKLPEGWKIVASNHSMWSHLLDDKGRKRASIFYKAAFYDRSAHIGICHRFSCSVEPEEGYDSEFDHENSPRICVITDCEKIVWKSTPMSPSENIQWYNIEEHLRPLGEAWLTKHYPHWEDELAYW